MQPEQPTPLGVQDVNCRNCGAPARVDLDKNPEWLCADCDHYQSTIACPTCHQPVRIDQLPAELVPAPADPGRKKKGSD
jgi:hypothetical protein